MLDDIWVQKRNEKIFFVIMIAALSALVWFNWVVGLLFFIITGGLLIYIKKNDYQQEQVLMKYLDDLSAGVTAGSAYAIKNLPVALPLWMKKGSWYGLIMCSAPGRISKLKKADGCSSCFPEQGFPSCGENPAGLTVMWMTVITAYFISSLKKAGRRREMPILWLSI